MSFVPYYSILHSSEALGLPQNAVVAAYDDDYTDQYDSRRQS